jgi:chemotaxis protein MotB
MSKLKDKLEQAVRNSAALQKIKEHVVFTITSEGLRVEMLEGDDSTFFESGSPLPTRFGEDLLQKLAEEIGKLPNKVTVEGHTDSRPYLGRADYSNWELSADRANAARRLMQEKGIRADQVTQVRGFADQSLRNPANPKDGTNRRITLIIQYQDDPAPPAKHTDPAANRTRPPPAAPAPAPAQPPVSHR